MSELCAAERMTRVKKPEDIPDTPHYAVLIYKVVSVYIPGDERSRTHPGHGYPEHTERHETFEHWVTTSIEDLKTFVRAFVGARSPFAVLRVEGKATLTTETFLTF